MKKNGYFERNWKNWNWDLCSPAPGSRLEHSNRNFIMSIYVYVNFSLEMLLYLVCLKKSLWKCFQTFFGPHGVNLGSRLSPKHVSERPNIDQQLLFWTYYSILLLWNFPGFGWVAGWVVGRKSNFNENPVVQLGLGLWLRVCQHD